MAAAANCGVALLATIHALDEEELRRKPLYPVLAASQVFRRLITISVEAGQRRYQVRPL